MNTKVVYDALSRITQHYGGGHGGVDIGWRSDESQNRVFAHSAGTVVAAVDGKDLYPYDDGTMNTYGNYVDIDHGNGYKTRYAHLRKGTVSVGVGQQVDGNTQIAIMGESGNVSGRHLHFEVFQNGVRINPEPYLYYDFGAAGTATYQAYDNVKGYWLPNVSISTDEYAGNFGNPIGGIYLDQFQLRVHDMVKGYWLPWVQNRNDYAGNLGNAIDAIQSNAPSYRVHIVGEGWTNWVNGNNVAGTYGKAIDAVQFSLASYI